MSNVLKMLLVRVVIYITLLPYLVLCAAIIDYVAFNVYAKLYFNQSYIISIDTPSYPQTAVVLQDFSNLSGTKIVSFEDIPNGRPIDIAEMEDGNDEYTPNMLGVAYSRFDSCSIRLKKDMDPEVFRETLIHEYLHCYGYMHVLDEADLMYPTLNLIDKEENIRQYAIKVRKYFYE